MKNLGLVTTILLFTLVTNSIECLNPPPLNCNYYRECLESKVGCGDQGYALGYGEKYCNKFLQITPKLSDKGQAFMVSTMHCLQGQLNYFLFPETRPKLSPFLLCEKISDEAYESHPYCYTQHENSICFLNPITDLPIIFKQYEAQDLITQKSRLQIKKVVQICMASIVNKQVQLAHSPFGSFKNEANDSIESVDSAIEEKMLELENSYQFWLDLDSKIEIK